VTKSEENDGVQLGTYLAGFEDEATIGSLVREWAAMREKRGEEGGGH